MTLRRPTASEAAASALVVCLLLAGAYPLGRLLLLPLLPALGPPQAPSEGGLRIDALADTVRIGLESASAALLPGLALAFLLERRRWRGGPALTLLLWAVFFTPSYLIVTGWRDLAATAVFRGSALPRLLYSECGIVALLALKGLPFAALTARTGWAAIGGEIGWAAQVHVRASWRRVWILLRLMLPVAGAAFAVVFIEAIGDFGVAATLGARLHLPLVIYAVYTCLARTPVDFVGAARLSLVLIALAAAAVAVHQVLSRRFGAALTHGRARPASRPPLGAAASIVAWAAVGMLLLGVVALPAVALAIRAAAPDEAAALSPAEARSVLYSVCYAGLAATASLGLALVLLKGGGGRVMDGLTLGAMAVPGIVLGAAYVIAFNGALPLYGTPLLLLAGYVATHLPMLTRFLQAPLGQSHASLGDAARLHGLDRLTRIERVHAPLLLRPVLWGWAIAFGGVFFELPLSSILYPVGRASVGVQLLGLDENLRFGAEARLAMGGAAACAAVVGAVLLLTPRLLSAGRPAR